MEQHFTAERNSLVAKRNRRISFFQKVIVDSLLALWFEKWQTRGHIGLGKRG
jgi:hypothetical protein